MDIKEIVTAFGAYYENSGQNTQRILRMLTQGTETPTVMTPVKTDDTVFKLAQAHMKSIIQPFRKGWHPQHASSFTPNELKLFKIKVDEDITPDDVEATWLGFLSGEGIARKDWPLVKYLIETLYIPQINQDMELSAYFWGVRKDPVSDNDSVAPEDSMDGLHLQLQRGVDEGTINLVESIGELDPVTIFDQVESFDDAIKGVYQSVPMTVCMAPEMKKAFLRDKRSKGFYDLTSDKDVNTGIDFSPRQVTGLPSMINYKYLFATPKANMLHLTKKSANKTNIGVEESKREVSFMCDWWEGVGFGMNAAVWTTQPKTPVKGA